MQYTQEMNQLEFREKQKGCKENQITGKKNERKHWNNRRNTLHRGNKTPGQKSSWWWTLNILTIYIKRKRLKSSYPQSEVKELIDFWRRQRNIYHKWHSSTDDVLKDKRNGRRDGLSGSTAALLSTFWFLWNNRIKCDLKALISDWCS